VGGRIEWLEKGERKGRRYYRKRRGKKEQGGKERRGIRESHTLLVFFFPFLIFLIQNKHMWQFQYFLIKKSHI